MGANLIVTSFAGGEMSPALYGRTDEARFHVSASVLRNCFVNLRGGADSRAGTQFVGHSQQDANGLPPRIITFRFNIFNDYVLEFGDRYVRIVYQGSYVTETPIPISGVSTSSPARITTSIANSFAMNDGVFVTGIAGQSALNNRFYLVESPSTFTFSLFTTFSVPVSSAGLPPYVSGGTVARIYTVVSPYAVEDLSYIKFTQSADVMSLTCVNPNTGVEYPPYDLERFSATDWRFTQTSFGSKTSAPTNCSASASTTTPTPLTSYAFCVTAVDKTTGQESVASNIAYVDSVGIDTTAGSITITWDAVVNADYYNVYQAPPAYDSPVPIGSTFSYIGSSYGNQFVDSNITPDPVNTPPLHLNPFARGAIATLTKTGSGTGYTQAGVTYSIATSTGSGAVLAPVVVNGDVVAVVVENHGEDYADGDTFTLTADGTGATFDLVLGPHTGTYPSVVNYFQQRRVYAGSLNQPDTYWMSQPGAYTNFDTSNPPIDSDAITGNPWAQQVNGIQWLQPMPGGLIVATGLDAWQVSGTAGANSPITPAQQSAQPQEAGGFSPILPMLRIKYDLIGMQPLGTVVVDMEFNFFTNIYSGQDISLFSNHLFENYQIPQWAWAKEPYKLVWAVRNDGKFLSLTYVKEQKVYGWARHDTLGQAVSVTSASEPPVDSPYFVMKRYVDGEKQYAYYIERMNNRRWQGPEDPWCVDCALELPQTKPTASLSASTATGLGTLVDPLVTYGGSGYTDPQIIVRDFSQPGKIVNGIATVVAGVITAWTANGAGFKTAQVLISDSTGSGAALQIGVDNSVVFTSTPGVFTAGDVGAVVRMGGGAATITAVPDPEHVVAQFITPIVLTVPNDPKSRPVVQPAGKWSVTQPIQTLTNLDHLEGMVVSVLADGNAVEGLLVTNGSVTLPAPASAIRVGLPFVAQVQTLHSDIPGGATIQGQPKHIGTVTVRMQGSRGIQVGANQPIAATLDFQQEVSWGQEVKLQEITDRTTYMIYGVPIPLYTGDKSIVIPDVWKPAIDTVSYGMVCAQQVHCLPMSVIALIYELEVAPDDAPTGSSRRR